MKETFGQRFARLRKAKGLRQEDIGDKIGISAQAVSKWENDISLPDVTLLGELSDILGVSLDELLGKEKTRTEVVAPNERKDMNKMMIKVMVDSADGDKIRVNLPLALVKIWLESGSKMPEINGKSLEGVDLKQIIELVDQGVIGELVTIDSNDGDRIVITVE